MRAAVKLPRACARSSAAAPRVGTRVTCLHVNERSLSSRSTHPRSSSFLPHAAAAGLLLYSFHSSRDNYECSAVACAAAAPDTRLTNDEKLIIQLFKSAQDSVVCITNMAQRRDIFSQRPNGMAIPQGTGSGFVWDSEGHIITNCHVIRGASKLCVTLSGEILSTTCHCL